MDKHIEAAAAAYVRHMAADWKADPNLRQLAAMETAITAYLESLASAGEDGVVEAMWHAYEHQTGEPPYNEGMRAALAVARATEGGGNG